MERFVDIFDATETSLGFLDKYDFFLYPRFFCGLVSLPALEPNIYLKNYLTTGLCEKRYHRELLN